MSSPGSGQEAIFGSSVDANEPPWSGIAMVTNSAHGRCTGVLINATTVLTAAHCLYSRRTSRYVRPQSVNVLLGYDRGSYGFHSVTKSFHVGTDYDPKRSAHTVMSDWAMLTLEKSAPSAYRPFAVAPVSGIGQTVLAAGFAQERSEIITRTPACVIKERAENGLIVSDCRVSQGLSGGPLIDVASHSIIAVQVASTEKNERLYTLSIPLTRIPWPFDP